MNILVRFYDWWLGQLRGQLGNQEDAQACFDYCWDLTGQDVHGLDSDNDGVACESLPDVPFGGWGLRRP